MGLSPRKGSYTTMKNVTTVTMDTDGVPWRVQGVAGDVAGEGVGVGEGPCWLGFCREDHGTARRECKQEGARQVSMASGVHATSCVGGKTVPCVGRTKIFPLHVYT